MFLKVLCQNLIVEKSEHGIDAFVSIDEKGFELLMKSIAEKVPHNVIEKYLYPRCTQSFGLECRMELSSVGDKKAVD